MYSWPIYTKTSLHDHGTVWYLYINKTHPCILLNNLPSSAPHYRAYINTHIPSHTHTNTRCWKSNGADVACRSAQLWCRCAEWMDGVCNIQTCTTTHICLSVEMKEILDKVNVHKLSDKHHIPSSSRWYQALIKKKWKKPWNYSPKQLQGQEERGKGSCNERKKE